MRKTTFILLLCATFALFSSKANAQDGYTWTLQHNGGYSFTVQAVPNTSSNNFATSVQSYGFTLILSDGISITSNSSLGGTASLNFFDGAAISQPAIDGYLVTETPGSPISLPAPSAGTNTDVLTFTVNGTPTSGDMYILENNSTLANNINPLKSFMQADMIDDGSALFANVVDPNAAAVTGMSTFNFSTLSTEGAELQDVNVFPNPVKNVATITGVADIESIVVTNLNGQRVLNQVSSLSTIDMSSLKTGIYFAKITAAAGSKTVKLIKE
ncbi:MAG: T9SS type A sorting domain-containing protein [Bacteroidota bacterium]